MTIHQSDFAKGIKDVVYPATADRAVAYRFAMAVPANAAVNDILELAVIPAGCRPVEVTVDSDDLDTNATPTLAFDVGMMSGDVGDPSPARTCGAEFLTGAQIGRTGGVAKPSTASAYRVPPAPVARSIGVKITTAAATAAPGQIGITVLYATV
ncbi:hypothetical protein BN1110_06298 [bacterium YEK0313]|nr:hypothetical protein BN1110_06298 [bacterium YEK0313]